MMVCDNGRIGAGAVHRMGRLQVHFHGSQRSAMVSVNEQGCCQVVADVGLVSQLFAYAALYLEETPQKPCGKFC